MSFSQITNLSGVKLQKNFFFHIKIIKHSHTLAIIIIIIMVINYWLIFLITSHRIVFLIKTMYHFSPQKFIFCNACRERSLFEACRHSVRKVTNSETVIKSNYEKSSSDYCACALSARLLYLAAAIVYF